MPTMLVTGASRGLGREFVRQYAGAGWRVIACCRRPECADALALFEGDIHIQQLDVEQPGMIAALAEKLAPMAIDLVINNAGRMSMEPAARDVTPEAFLDSMRANALAPLLISRAFLPHVAAGKERKIVSITSLMGSIGDNTSGGFYSYRASKAALNMVMKCLALEAGRQGVSVAVINPGWVRTEMGGANASLTPQESVTGMRRVIERLGPEASGGFFHYNGELLPW